MPSATIPESGARTGFLERETTAGLSSFIDLCASCIPELDTSLARTLAMSAVRYYRGNADERANLRAFQELEQRWYSSLNTGQPDYGVYADPYMVSDLWACWIVYSRQYLRDIQKPNSLIARSIVADMGQVRGVADLGCGIAYTCAAFAELFPSAQVWGTNLANTPQYAVAAAVAAQYNVRLVPSAAEITGPVDLLFASEYFEHIADPCRHLAEVITHLRPRYVLTANAFTATSLGHFPQYRYGQQFLPGSDMSRLFSKTMAHFGYVKQKTKLWNNRPTYWVHH